METMGLADIQSMLAQLYTNTALREHFLSDPQAVGQRVISELEFWQLGLGQRQRANGQQCAQHELLT